MENTLEGKSGKVIVAVVTAIILIIVAFSIFKDEEQISYSTAIAERTVLIQEINATGRIEAVESVDLAFESSGRVSRTYVSTGDNVYAGQVLIVLENSEESAQIAQAEATLAKDQAKLAELKIGVRPEEILVQEVKVANAKVALEDAGKNLVDELREAYTKADDAVRNKIDQFFNNPRTSNPQLNFVTDSQLGSIIEQGRIVTEETLQSWTISLGSLTVESDLKAYVDETNQNLTQIKSFLDKVGLAVNSLTVNSNLTQTTIDSWKLDAFTGRTNVDIAIANITAAEEKEEAAKSSLSLASQELTLMKSGTTEEQISAQEAQVKNSEANIKYRHALLNKTIIYSPISGVVTEQNAKVGEIVSANTNVVSIISEGDYQIEAFVVEADIANLEVGDIAVFTLDAFSEEEEFAATVIKIDPAAQLLEGVANYKTTLQLEEKDSERIRSGMTADIDIVTAERYGVIVIPQRAVIFKNGTKTVRVLKDKNIVEEIEVEIGISGSRGRIEIISGIEEGDVVITAIKD